MPDVAHIVGHPAAAPVALVGFLLLWAAVGVDMANITISILSLVLLFVIQHSQNRDGAAIQAKLDALIKGVKDADNHFIGLDRKEEAEIEEARRER